MRASLEQRLFGAETRAAVGRYELIEAVGRGGMGTVFRAHDPALSREVAVKVLSGAGIGSERSALVGRLVREARLLAQLNHPNVIAVHDVGEDQGDVFIAMEYVRGRTFRAWMDDEPPATRQRLMAGIELLLEAGRGLAAAHALGVVHRDFKPDNVLVGTDGRVRVVDFGLAHGQLEVEPDSGASSTTSSDILTGSGQLVGTPAYMAPEQFDRGAITAAADQYAFCVTLFELAFGQRPHAGVSLEELPSRVRAGRVQLPDAPAVPSALARILQRGLATDPSARYRDLAALLRDLERLRGVRRRTAGIALLVLGAAGGAATTLSLSEATESPACGDVAVAIDELWTPAVADEIRAAFAATERPYAEAAAGRVIEALDAYAVRWRDARVDACEDTLVRGEHSADVMDRRTACLQRTLREVSATLEVMRTASAQVVDDAMAAAARLPPTEPCEQIDVLLTIVPVPDDAQVRAAIDRVESGTARARALVGAGRYPDAAAALEGLSEVAESTGHAPTLANLLAARSDVEVVRGDLTGAAATARLGFAAALRGGDDRRAARGAVQIAQVSVKQSQTDVTLEWTGVARALIERIGGDRSLEAHVAYFDGLAYDIRAEFAAAERELVRSIELFRENGSAARATVVRSGLAGVLVNAGELDRAESTLEHAIAEKHEIHGADHPTIATDLYVRGMLNIERKAWADAVRWLDEAATMQERLLGASHPILGSTLTGLGAALVGRSELDRAVPTLERAVAIHTAAFGESTPHVIKAQLMLATAYTEHDRQREAAELVERVVAGARTRMRDGDPELASTLGTAAEKLLAAGQASRAGAIARDALAAIENTPKASPGVRRRVLASCEKVLRATGDAARAAEASTRMAELAASAPATK